MAWALPFDIPEQDLPSALLRFSQQSGLNVIRDGSVSGLRSRAVKGDYSAAQALRLMLSDTGLEFVSSASGMRILHPQEAEEGVQQLPALDIIGTHSPVFDKYKTPEIQYEVTREQLDRVPYSRVGDIFNGVPGVASANSANGAGLEINIRGLQGMGRVKTLVDGSMQTTNTYRGYAGNRDSTFIDPDLIGSIDIKKDPDAGPQGAGVVGGIVNMRTLTATDIITDPDKNWGIRLKGMYGDNVARDKLIYKDRTQSFNNTRRVYDFYQVDRRSGRGIKNSACYTPLGQRQCNDNRGNPKANIETYIGGAIPTENQSGSLAVWQRQFVPGIILS